MKFPKPAAKRETGGDMREFLKAKHIGKAGKRAQVTISGKARLHNGQFGEQVIVPVRLGKTEFDLGINTDKPNYSLLWEQMGDPSKWKGKINVVVVRGMRGDYLAVE